jgi:hypothetical protein
MPRPEVFIMSVGQLIDEDGKLHDERVRGQLEKFYKAFEHWIRRMKHEH